MASAFHLPQLRGEAMTMHVRYLHRSRAISAHNGAMIASMDRNRAAQNQADASRRAAARSGGNSSDSFSQMIRGTTKMSDPY